MAELLVSTITVEGAGTLEIYATETDAGVTFHVKTGDDWNSAYNLDLNGLFLDYTEGGSIKLTVDGEKSNNLNGTTYEGEKIYWDLAESTGSTVGGSDGQTSLMECTVTVEGLTLEQIDGGLIGIRATSTGLDGSGSLKLVGEIVVPEAPPVVDHFPNWQQPEISHVTFYFATGDNPYYSGDVNGTNEKPSEAEGWFTVKFDVTGSPSNEINDLDNWYAQALQFIQEENPTLDMSTLEGVSIKGGQEETWYEFDGDPSDNDSSEAPAVWIVENYEVDQAYEVTTDTGGDYILT